MKSMVLASCSPLVLLPDPCSSRPSVRQAQHNAEAHLADMRTQPLSKPRQSGLSVELRPVSDRQSRVCARNESGSQVYPGSFAYAIVPSHGSSSVTLGGSRMLHESYDFELSLSRLSLAAPGFGLLDKTTTRLLRTDRWLARSDPRTDRPETRA